MRYEKNPETGRMWYNLSGDRFGRWTVLECTGRTGRFTGKMNGQTTWRCRCDCGKEKESVTFGALRNGVSTSCGCFRGEVLGLRAKKHGDSRAKAYRAWQQAKDRCFNHARPCWNHYGGRGITMCEGFRENYRVWRDALGPAPTPKYSVDRRDNDGSYSCGICSQCVENQWKLNIHWATQGQQNLNRSSTQRVFWEGCLRSITEIARMENVALCSLRNRIIQEKMQISDAVEDCRSRGLIFNERAKTILEANPDIVQRRPNRTYRKRVPNNSLTPVPNN
jgi:hypothetical protein